MNRLWCPDACSVAQMSASENHHLPTNPWLAFGFCGPPFEKHGLNVHNSVIKHREHKFGIHRQVQVHLKSSRSCELECCLTVCIRAKSKSSFEVSFCLLPYNMYKNKRCNITHFIYFRCQFCNVCGRTDNLLECKRCSKSYHSDCLGPGYPNKYVFLPYLLSFILQKCFMLHSDNRKIECGSAWDAWGVGAAGLRSPDGALVLNGLMTSNFVSVAGIFLIRAIFVRSVEGVTVMKIMKVEWCNVVLVSDGFIQDAKVLRVRKGPLHLST